MMIHNKGFEDSFVGALRQAGHEVRSYSGRGMYGDHCVALVTESPLLAVLEGIMEMGVTGDDADEFMEDAPE